jgi:hypothetical protein
MTNDFRDRKRPNNSESLGRSRPLVHALNRLLITLSHALLVSTSIILIVQSFALNIETGVRSLAAAALPPIIITYLTFFTRSLRAPVQLPPVLYFFIAAIWMITLLILVTVLTEYGYSYGYTVGVFIFSLTFSGLLILSRNIPFPSLLSTSYGIVSGLLVYTLIFGIPFLDP